MVIVLIGILSVIIAPRLPNITTTNAGAFADKLRADVRYAQDLAMTRSLRSRVDFSVADQYTIRSSTTTTCSSFVPAVDPATGSPFTVTVNSGVYAGLTIAPSMNCLEYDSLGQPYNCVGAAGCSASPSGMSVTVNANGAPARVVTVSPQTGAVN
jgi:type II secretory pathway pseudopilin PulG